MAPLKYPSLDAINRLIGSPVYRDTQKAARYFATSWPTAQYHTDCHVDERSSALGDYGRVRNEHKNPIVCRASTGKTLLVGEGSLSFTASLVFDWRINPKLITSTVHDSFRDISNVAKSNARKLSDVGVTVLDQVDAPRLDQIFGHQQFDTIIFQFPNAGSRESNRGHNPNFVLVRRFLKSAVEPLRQDGEIVVSVVDNSYYDGRFRIDEAADYAEIKDFLPFHPDDFPSYTHVNTNDEGSALKEHRSFETWIFRP